MNLIPEPNQPGLWTNSEWQPGTPGAFAVIIGVSQYDHLAGGKPGAVASETYGLGQLAVSAYTAYSFFTWLRDSFRYNGVTLARCWLLLAPTPDELAYEPALGEHPLPPMLQNCEDAIGAWYLEMKRLDAQNAVQSRSFFFFSGHGLQVTEDCQILLPQDYLRPPAENANRAISTQNLANGVKSLKIPHHFFFLDACRNDHSNLSKVASLEGVPVLNVLKSSFNNPDCFTPLFYASASATQAWQPPDPAQGTSIFGQALLEGLRAQAGMAPNCSPPPCVVDLDLLRRFVSRRVNAIMQRYNATVGQRVRVSGDWTETPVTEVDYDPTLAGPPPALEAAAPYEMHTPPPGWRPIPENYAETHAILGSEEMSDLWIDRARLCPLPQVNPQQPDWLPVGQDFVIHQVERQGTGAYRIELSIAPAGHSPGLFWLQLTDRLDRSFACLLPGDPGPAPRYLLELVLGEAGTPGAPRPLLEMEAGLALSNEGPLQDAAALWQIYTQGGAGEALKTTEMQRLGAMLGEAHGFDLNEALAALVAGLVLLRTRRWSLLQYSLRGLAARFAYLPDGPVLLLEQLLGQAGEASLFVDLLLELETRGLPATSEGFSYAARQAALFLQYSEDLAATQRSALGRVQTRLRGALPYLRSGGLFAVFAGPAAEIHPGLVQPQPP